MKEEEYSKWQKIQRRFDSFSLGALLVFWSIVIPIWLSSVGKWSFWESFIIFILAFPMGLLSLIYTIWVPIKGETKEKISSDDKCEKDKSQKTDLLILEYELFTKEARERGSQLLRLESMSAAGSFVVVALAMDILSRTSGSIWRLTVFILLLLATLLISSTIYMRWTTEKINDLQINRLRKEIEPILNEQYAEKYKIGGHSFIYSQIHDKFWYKLRKRLWELMFGMVVIIYFILMMVVLVGLPLI